MARKLTFRQLQVLILAAWHDLSFKEIGAEAGMDQKLVSHYLRRGEVNGEVFQRLLRAMKCRPAAVRSVAACLEALEALEKAMDLSEEELSLIEEAALESSRLTREILSVAARRSRSGPMATGYPQTSGLFLARRRADELWSRLHGLNAEARLAVVQVAEEFQVWPLCERVCEESRRAASHQVEELEEATVLSRLAREIAHRVPGPEGWRNRLQGYAAAHEANALRVAGELKAAASAFAAAKRLWQSGADPAGILDPGRVLELEASLRRDLRRAARLRTGTGRRWLARTAPARVSVRTRRRDENSASASAQERMRREHLMARLFRALSGKTQKQFGKETGVHPNLVAQYELGQILPGPARLARLARGASLTVVDGDEILRLADVLRGAGRLGREEAEDLDDLGERLRALISRSRRRLLTLPLPESLPKPGDRVHAGELWRRLKELDGETRRVVVRVAEEFQDWALCEAVCEESTRAASRKVEEAAALAWLAREIADRVRGPEGWRSRMRGYAAAHEANVLRVSGELRAAEIAFEQATRLWLSGADPAGLLDPGRLPDLEASLRRDQRRFAEALTLLDAAMAVGRRPERVLTNKGFTLEVMGEYERAVETLLQAEPLLDREGEPRLWYHQRFNLAVNHCHLGRYAEAVELARQVRALATGLGDATFLIRVTWLEGRIAAGLGRPEEALRLLEEARRRFAAEKMSYDVALALLEEAVLLLAAGRTAEVKALARELTQVLESKGVHREALAALRLFQEAVEREEATAELARGVLRYLFRARHDQGLRFEPSTRQT